MSARLFLIPALVLWLISPQVAPQQPPTETIAGVVIRADTRSPLPNTRLELVREDHERRPTGYEKPCKPQPDTEITNSRRFVVSDSIGKFRFDNIVPGRYYLIAQREGFLRTEYGQRGRFPIGTVLTIGPQPEVVLVPSESDLPAEVLVNTTVPASTVAPPRGLGRDQPGVNAGAPSAFRDGTIEQTGVRGGLGRDATRVAGGAPSALSEGPATGTPRNLLQDIAIAMIPAPTIAGRVLDETGATLAAAAVQAYQFRYTPMNGRTLRPVREALTSDDGDYRLFWLDPGRYIVAAGRSTYALQPWMTGLSFTPNLPGADSGNPTTFYPVATTASTAIGVPLNPGEQPLVDVRLRDRQRFTVRIRLLADRLPASPTLVFVPFGGDLCTTPNSAIPTLNNGVFEIRDVPAGIYVAAAMSGRDFISDLITFNADNATNLALAVVPPTEIRGNVSFNVVPKEIDIGAIRVNLTRTNQELHQVATAVIDPSTGRFSIPGVGPGSYYTSLDLPPGFYVQNVAASKFDRLSPGNCSFDPSLWSPASRYLDGHGHLDPADPLRVPQVIPNASECLAIQVNFGLPIVGLVRDKSGKNVSGALVVAIPKSVWAQSGDGGVTAPDQYVTGATDSVGRFELWGATHREGQEYHLFAFEDIDPNMIYDLGFSERFHGKESFVIRREGKSQLTWLVQQIRTVTVATSLDCPGVIVPDALRQTCLLTAVPAEETAGIR